MDKRSGEKSEIVRISECTPSSSGELSAVLELKRSVDAEAEPGASNVFSPSRLTKLRSAGIKPASQETSELDAAFGVCSTAVRCPPAENTIAVAIGDACAAVGHCPLPEDVAAVGPAFRSADRGFQ